MDGKNAQELFLLEFLVDRVNIPSVQAMHEDLLTVKTCIEFKILNLAPIYICQDSPSDCCACLGEDAQIFRKGKSCLFALPRRLLLEQPICSFPVLMTVYKKLPPSVLPDMMTIGTCQIDVSDMLNCLVQESSADPREKPCKTLKNNFRITTATGQCVGEVCAFLRFSQLGRKVVTQFQNPHNRKPYLFKGADESPVFQCRKVPSQLPDPNALSTCVCKKDACKGEEKQPPKSCCNPGGGSGGDTRREKTKGTRKGTRPCCGGARKGHRSAGKSQSQNCESSLSCGQEAKEKPTRQCGCEIKEDKKAFACGKS